MKFEGSITIDKPVGIVTGFFADPSNLKEWQDGFVKKELLEGVEGKDGAISKMYYSDGKRDMVLTETIISNKLPDSFEAFYHHKHMDNTMKCQFTSIAADQTNYSYQFEYTRINWILPRLMAIFFPGIYRKQGEKWMKQFKEYVEKHG